MLSTGNVFIEVRLDQHQTTLIVGNNGHGKSSLLDAISFALFGKPFRRVNKGNLVNSINNKDCVVELEFQIGLRQYKIIRGINPNIFEIYIDDEMVDQDAVSKDYQRYLETNILKFNFRAFSQIVILGSKSFIPFMKLGPQDRRAVIENLLDIQIFSLMNQVAKRDLITAREAVTENKKNIESTQAQIELQKKYVEDSKKNAAETQSKLQDEIEQNREHLKKLAIQESDLKDQADALMEKIQDKSEIESKLRQLSQYEAKIEQNQLKASRDFHFYHDNSNCPTCKQELDEEFKKNAIASANAKIEQYGTALNLLMEKQNKLNERLTEIQEIMKAYHAIQAEIHKIGVSCTHIHLYIEKLLGEIAELANKKVLSEDMMAVSEELMKKLVIQNGNHRTLIENRAYYEIAVNLLKDGGIKGQIIKQYLPVINKLVNKYLAAMDFFVNFELNEEFVESIKSRHRDQFTYDSFSEGEKQKIDIALLFAWRAVAKLKNSINTNLLILDEIFDSSLDGTGADLVLAILAAMPHESNVFVISHRELLHDKFQHTIKFEKRNNFSEIVSVEE